ncbi:DUF2231 domain-containing protein [Sinorhizobium medicae]|uniref:DUF2231 domain-containing protein n=2 Tax=Sinorhizobium medicae TaxID=110321 RepID=A0A508X3C8_9HYPH|nr:DUF2231 domain-containing protein [Sinorhizobium medicae]ABR63554.1 conserved hypothetical membrane protein [Sinorhizobium medicae WSM419]MBO1941836.1 DUF2231 domain-containing protein [Sinorhizobium medicae]MBO1960858.1 DUF2231 domain-containing protein [Sinorhizobium medicae]MDX0407474.1 DUF2231 domain-containing protein [Sinorhizobium medicae]MDX0413238.1 DUF2231 domain-containing protein [Sinorhizobium medicae]
MSLTSASTAMTVTTPVHSLLVPFPAVCFTLALLTDIAFWQTGHIMWQNFSAWLLFAGIAFGVISGLVGIVEFLLRSDRRARGSVWLHVVGYVLVLGLAFVNNLVHAGDGWTAVVPYGLILSAATVLLTILVALLGRAVLHRTQTRSERS